MSTCSTLQSIHFLNAKGTVWWNEIFIIHQRQKWANAPVWRTTDPIKVKEGSYKHLCMGPKSIFFYSYPSKSSVTSKLNTWTPHMVRAECTRSLRSHTETDHGALPSAGRLKFHHLNIDPSVLPILASSEETREQVLKIAAKCQTKCQIRHKKLETDQT